LINNLRPPRYVALIAGFIIGIFLLAPYIKWLEPDPFNDVRIESVEVKPDKMLAVLSFAPTQPKCEFRKLVILGRVLEYWEPLDWKSMDGETWQQKNGRYTVWIEINNPKFKAFDELFIRSRHKCGDRIVDRDMAAIVVDRYVGQKPVESGSAEGATATP
jgi:hypothetical protein